MEFVRTTHFYTMKPKILKLHNLIDPAHCSDVKAELYFKP